MDREAILLNQLDRLQGFFPRVEGKATFLSAILLAMVGTTAVNFPIKEPCSIFAVLAYFIIGLACLSGWRIYRTLFPHLGSAPRPSLLYFGDIAGQAEPDFIAKIKNATASDLMDDAASQIWRNSEILALKYRFIKEAFQLAAVAVLPWIIFLAGSAVARGVLPKLGAG